MGLSHKIKTTELELQDWLLCLSEGMAHFEDLPQLKD